MSFYQAALQAARTSAYADPATLDRLRAAQEFIQRRATEFQQSLDRALADFEPERHGRAASASPTRSKC